jgi:hypothetical protein
MANKSKFNFWTHALIAKHKELINLIEKYSPKTEIFAIILTWDLLNLNLNRNKILRFTVWDLLQEWDRLLVCCDCYTVSDRVAQWWFCGLDAALTCVQQWRNYLFNSKHIILSSINYLGTKHCMFGIWVFKNNHSGSV